MLSVKSPKPGVSITVKSKAKLSSVKWAVWWTMFVVLSNLIVGSTFSTLCQTLGKIEVPKRVLTKVVLPIRNG